MPNPALAAAGTKVKTTQWKGVLLSGALAAIASASSSLQLSSPFTRNMSAGHGDMAFATFIVGRCHPIPTCLAAVAYAFCEALQIVLLGTILFGVAIPGQFIQIFSYIVTLFTLIFAEGRFASTKSLRGLNDWGLW